MNPFEKKTFANKHYPTRKYCISSLTTCKVDDELDFGARKLVRQYAPNDLQGERVLA